MSKILKARSPAKLILSGEHAVVYGKPAIAMAIDCYAESAISSIVSSAVLFNLLNLEYAKSFTLQTLYALKQRLQDKYRAFLEGHCGIREVLKMPFELLQFTVSNLLEKWNMPLSQGLEICAFSDIPMGCGMGSSAALVMSTLYALGHYLKLDLDSNRYLALGKEAENLQHGYSSGLDLHLALTGGCLRFQEGVTEVRSIPNFPMSIIQTGSPEVTTGQCVSAVAKHFKQSSIGDDFGFVTEAMDKALIQQDLTEIQRCIRENQVLLTKIGVVPSNIQALVKAIEAKGGAAKICGAGSIAGQQAGVMLVVSEADNDLNAIVRQYGYDLQPVRGDYRGTHLL